MAKLDKALAKQQDSELVIADTVVFEVYEWLIPEARKPEVKHMITTLYQNVTKEASGKRKKPVKTATQDSASEAAMALFKKRRGARK